MNIVIVAGGGGTRLWPLSKKALPKQFLDLGTGKTLIEHTFDRALQLTDASNIYVATTEEHVAKTKEVLPMLSPNHIFTEPERRETGPALAATAIQLVGLGKGDEPVLFLWADHVFTDEASLVRDLNIMGELVAKDSNRIVIMGHVPVSPETGYGYMKMGEKVEGYDHVHKIDEFKEKPDLETAEGYVAAQTYFWNMGYICVTPNFFLQELAVHTPELVSGVRKFAEALAGHDEQQAKNAYHELPKIAIDYALNEKTKHIIAVTGDYGWSDVGSWAVVKELFGVDGDHVPKGHHVHVDSDNNYIYNATDKAVSLIGIHNTVVVVTDNAILISDTASSQKVKDVVKKIEENGKDEYL
ncbi:MAG: NTP transferase domain-containing protein [Candidatus Andersenbacteria bacterium]|nr:NTP transferase domain-containing protein [Candidatus Andersenbacteria bacterium]